MNMYMGLLKKEGGYFLVHHFWGKGVLYALYNLKKALNEKVIDIFFRTCELKLKFSTECGSKYPRV